MKSVASANAGVMRPPPRTQAALDAGRFDPECARCGRPLAPEPVPEDAPADPRNVYAATKLLIRPRLEIAPAERQTFREETIPYWASPERRAALLAVLEKRR